MHGTVPVEVGRILKIRIERHPGVLRVVVRTPRVRITIVIR